jgi:hypothetical protein
MENLEPLNWIDQALTDLIIFKYEHRFWISQEQVWRKWIRTSERGTK